MFPRRDVSVSLSAEALAPAKDAAQFDVLFGIKTTGGPRTLSDVGFPLFSIYI